MFDKAAKVAVPLPPDLVDQLFSRLVRFGFTCRKADKEGDVLLGTFSNVLSVDGDFFFHSKVKRLFNFPKGLENGGKVYTIEDCILKSTLSIPGWYLLGVVSGNDYSKLPGFAAGRAFNTISRLPPEQQTLKFLCEYLKVEERYTPTNNLTYSVFLNALSIFQYAQETPVDTALLKQYAEEDQRMSNTISMWRSTFLNTKTLKNSMIFQKWQEPNYQSSLHQRLAKLELPRELPPQWNKSAYTGPRYFDIFFYLHVGIKTQHFVLCLPQIVSLFWAKYLGWTFKVDVE